MRTCRLLAAAALLACVASGAAVTKASAWLSAHGRNPNQDDLSALRVADPTSYGIVKALLAKQQLGLLDPRHPMASTFGTAKSDSGEEHVYGAAAFAKFSAPADGVQKRVEEPELYAEAPSAPAHHDWMNWKPPTSAMGEEDDMVKSVLGGGSDAEAAPPAKAPEPAAPADRYAAAPSTLDSDASLVAAEPAAAAAPEPMVQAPEPEVQAPVEAPEPPAAPRAASQDNPYLQGVNFGSVATAAVTPVEEEAPRAQPVAAASAGNPYLQGIDFSEASTDAPAQAPSSLRGADATPKRSLELSTNSLSTFSWGEDAEAAKAPPSAPEVEAAPAPVQAQVTQVDASVNPLGEKLSNWLGAAMLQKSAKPVAKAKSPLDIWKHNIYMDDLQ